MYAMSTCDFLGDDCWSTSIGLIRKWPPMIGMYSCQAFIDECITIHSTYTYQYIQVFIIKHSMYIIVYQCTVTFRYIDTWHMIYRYIMIYLHFLKISFTSVNPNVVSTSHAEVLAPSAFPGSWSVLTPWITDPQLKPIRAFSSKRWLKLPLGPVSWCSLILRRFFLGGFGWNLNEHDSLNVVVIFSPLRKKLRSVYYFRCQIGCPLFPGFDSNVRQMDLQHHKVPRFTRCSVFPFTVTCYENEA